MLTAEQRKQWTGSSQTWRDPEPVLEAVEGDRQVTLPPFAPDEKCPKCLHDLVRTAYCGGAYSGARYGYLCRTFGSEVPGEHLHRTCQRCHFEWLERCVGAEADTRPKEEGE
jgi:hypothetical protein